ncbi:MAG: hypothetical protein WCD86_16755 [Ktedonobacteraceae bacterium]
MTLTNHVPDQPSPEASLHASTPAVEWMPLDGLIQSWAAFASQSTQEWAFATASLALTALEQETAARRVYHDAHREAWPTSVQDALTVSLGHLNEAASSWLSALDRLEEYRTIYLPAEEEREEQAVLHLLADSYSHLLHVACLSVRLVQEVHTSLNAPVRVLIGTLHPPERKEAV